MARVSSLVIERFMRLARRSSDTWQGGLVKMPMWVGEQDEKPRRPWGAVWVSLETDLVSVKLAEGEPDWRLALDALAELGLRFAGTRPACVASRCARSKSCARRRTSSGPVLAPTTALSSSAIASGADGFN